MFLKLRHVTISVSVVIISNPHKCKWQSFSIRFINKLEVFPKTVLFIYSLKFIIIIFSYDYSIFVINVKFIKIFLIYEIAIFGFMHNAIHIFLVSVTYSNSSCIFFKFVDIPFIVYISGNIILYIIKGYIKLSQKCQILLIEQIHV